MANKEHLVILKSGVEAWNQWRAKNPDTIPDLSSEDLSEKSLSGANFEKAVLRTANLRGTDLRNANLREADLTNAYLREADLRDANLAQANLSLANLTNATLDKATLDLAKLWGAQTSSWSIKGTICKRVYWDKEAKTPSEYEPSEFEMLHSEKPIIRMDYEGGITKIEMILLPDIIEKLSSQHPGCALRLKSIIEGLDHATVEIAVEQSGGVNLEHLKQDWKRMQIFQRKVLGEHLQTS
jgi:hypothetical protein